MGIANVTALKKFVVDHESAPLADVADAINIALRLADEKENGATNHRLQAGRMLASLRKRIEADGQNWWKFAKDHFDRSRKDIEKVMRLANADNPAEAVETERAEAKTRMARSRSSGANFRSRQLVEIALLEDEEEKAAAKTVADLKKKLKDITAERKQSAAINRGRSRDLIIAQNMRDQTGAEVARLWEFFNDEHCPRLTEFARAHPELIDDVGSLILHLELIANKLRQLVRYPIRTPEPEIDRSVIMAGDADG
jgi:hypothetical protein